MENPRLIEFKIHKVLEQYPDTSHFATTVEEQIENKDTPAYLAQKYAQYDKELLDGLGKTWDYIGVYATAIIEFTNNNLVYTTELRSVGLWGLEIGHAMIDGVYKKLDEDYINEEISYQILELWQQLQDYEIRVSLEELDINFDVEIEYE